MTKTELIRYLKSNVSIQDSEVVEDSEFLLLSDEDIELYLKVALTRDFAGKSLDNLPDDCVYPLTLLAEKEMFYALAVKSAPLYNMTADSNNSLQRASRFEHYMSLVKQVESEYQSYLDNGGTNNTLSSYDVRLDNRYYTSRNTDLAPLPRVVLKVDEVNEDSILLSWSTSNVSHFTGYSVWMSDAPILDEYDVTQKVSSDAKLLLTIHDAHQNRARIKGLNLSDHVHYFCVEVTTLSLKSGYSEVSAKYESVTEPSGTPVEVTV